MQDESIWYYSQVSTPLFNTFKTISHRENCSTDQAEFWRKLAEPDSWDIQKMFGLKNSGAAKMMTYEYRYTNTCTL